MKRKVIGVLMIVGGAILMWFGFVCIFVSQMI